MIRRSSDSDDFKQVRQPGEVVRIAVGTGHLEVDWQRLERGLGPLQSVLAAGPFG